jgi:hypothetical protein
MMSVLPYYSAMENYGVSISEVDSFASPGKKWTLRLHIITQFSQGNSSRPFISLPFQSLIMQSYPALTFCESDNGSCLLSIGFLHFFILLCLGGSKHDRTASNRKSCFMKHLTHKDKENIMPWSVKNFLWTDMTDCNNGITDDPSLQQIIFVSTMSFLFC